MKWKNVLTNVSPFIGNFGGLFAIVVTLFFAVLWKAQLSEVRTQIAKELAEQKLFEARDRIFGYGIRI